jgi:hypothetical protein
MFVTLCLFLGISLTACTRTGASGDVSTLPTALPPSSPTQNTNASANAATDPSAIGTSDANGSLSAGTPSTAPERPLYVLNVSLDYEQGLINAQQRIEFKNPTGFDVTELKFSVPPARRSAALIFRDVRLYGAKEALKFDLHGPILSVQLPTPLLAQQAVAITFDFSVKVPLQEKVIGIGGDDTSRGLNVIVAGHWYIVLPPYKDGAWDLPEYAPVGDPFTSELADFEANVLAPAGVVVAAGGDETRDGRLWKYTLPKARVFAFAASDVWTIDTMTENGVTYVHYGFPRHQKFAEDVLYSAQRAVELFSQIYGPYPYKTLRVVETDRTQGQEYSGWVAIGALLYNNYSGKGARHDVIATTVHETAHQWWFNVVGNDQVRTPWLDESFARFAELKWYQTFYPNDVEWWYEKYIESKRRNKGRIDLSIYDYADSRAYIDAVYRNGLEFLRAVRDQVGREKFDTILQDYYRAEAYKIASADAFFDAVARHSDVDLTGTVRAYFAREVVLPCRISANAVGCRP